MMEVLYHGGSAAVLDRVKKHGLQPRAIHKGKDNWKHTVTSNKNSVYLTNAYPWHFAAVASDEKDTGVIYEINPVYLLPWKLCPDEDFMEQVTRKTGPEEGPNYAPTDWPMKKRTMHYRKIAKQFPQLASKSLEAMGTVGYYGTIPWKAVSRYVLIEWEKLHLEFRVRAVDSMISTMNYRILQDRHKAFIRWFFDDPVTAPELTGSLLWRNSSVEYPRGQEQVDKLDELYDKQDAGMARIMQQREGLTVVKGDEYAAIV